MRRALALTAAAVGLLGATTAPALSLQPYRPEPVDFSMPGEAVLGESDGGDGVVSEPLRAPKRFNLVGLTWDRDMPVGERDRESHAEPALAMRTRTDGGDWTPWTAVGAHSEDGPDPQTEEAANGMSNPVWAGEADWVQYRSSEALPDAELHFVNTAGTATASDRARTALRDTVNTAFGSIAGLFATDGAGAQEPQPAIVSRAQWGAQGCPPRTGPAYGQVKAAYIHHTVNLNDYSQDEAPQVVLGICRYHRNTNGWNDIGYNFLVDRFGTIYEGRAGGVGAAVIGAQAEGFNAQSTGIANIGTFTSVPQSEAAMNAMARLIRWKLPLHGVPTSGSTTLTSAGGGTNRYASGNVAHVQRVIGHRDTNATECPGSALYAQLPNLRSMVAGVQPQGVATGLTAAVASPSTVDFGGSVTVTGTLTSAGGAPVPNQAVEVQARVGSSWRTSSVPTTAADGSFSAVATPRQTRLMRVRFAGSGELRSSVAPSFAVAVRPIVTLVRPPRRGHAGEPVNVRGKLRPRKARVYQVLQLKRRGRFRNVGVKVVRTRAGGSFSDHFVPAGKGTYRFYVVAKGDSSTARGASREATVRVGSRRATKSVRGGAQAR